VPFSIAMAGWIPPQKMRKSSENTGNIWEKHGKTSHGGLVHWENPSN